MGDRLSARLRQDTRSAHAAAQGSGFLDALVAGLLPWEAYADLTAQHWFVYEALELAARTMADDPVARPFVFPELVRLPSIEADLRFLHGPRWSYRIAALPATTTYCTRLRYAANSHPIGFIAHHYTRYLGDLSGGQYLGRGIARAYGLNGDGHRFYMFDGINPEALKTYYRQLLDTLPWSPYEQDEFVTEVLEAYRLNTAVLEDLRRRWT
ncbi:heme oxygenase (biliverdin-producing) [Paractinoplanes toevensis]|uniref:Heme oxygenase n=1 Tax=Paractinoplanes toevensis TaxID=571911 RepID=A0A919TK70_9ACTN|nr:biliverdin-producing heme oxygenase [Actinoplanes toevensis]GIM95576.1 heme oxygenase [Actinoplanes toevensis]